MAQMSLYLFVSGGLSLLFAVFFHVAYTTMLAQRGGVAALRLSPARLAGVTAGGTATMSFGGGATDRWTGQTAAVGSLALIGTWVGWVLLALSLITRAIIVGRGPWGSMFEFSVAFAFGITSGYLYLQRRYPIRALGFIPTGVASFLLLYAFSLLLVLSVPGSTTVATFEPLVPALANAPLLTVHVAMAMISYGIFSVSFAAAVGYLIQGNADRFAWLPPRKTLDEVAYRSVIIGFPVFATMIILGSYWASIAWGAYWSWDPKETSALVTWLIYAVYLHARNARGWAGRPAALILVVGFAAIMFTFFGNLFFNGLHAYSGLS
ncbi:MAG TPA: cytochrome c biogenesis protein CcsA [Candidatus Baltobacteraceae bacterium]|nr:cytochrome c biogenesis protein CcsA [Candidatus Baltobacteraceae bacterium]